MALNSNESRNKIFAHVIFIIIGEFRNMGNNEIDVKN